MKKLVLGLGLEERCANCNFCGEESKDCIKGSSPFVVKFKNADYESIKVPKDGGLQLVDVMYDYDYSFTGKYLVRKGNKISMYACKDYEYKDVIRKTYVS